MEIDTNMIILMVGIIVIIMAMWIFVMVDLSNISTKLSEIKRQLESQSMRMKKSESSLAAVDIKTNKYKYGKCPVCNTTVWYPDKACKECGQKIKWNNKDEVNK